MNVLINTAKVSTPFLKKIFNSCGLKIKNVFSKIYKSAPPRYPKKTQRITILSPEGICESRTEGGPIVFTYALFVLGTDFDTFKITLLR